MRTGRYFFDRLLLATIISSAVLSCTVMAASRAQKNIILILTDDMGCGELSCYGNPIIKTPNIDKLHEQSIRFTNFHVAPSCAPTRAQLMSGSHEFKNGVTHTINNRERLNIKTKTLANVLSEAGYATSIFGKWHLGDEPAYRPDQRGFQEALVHGAGGLGQVGFGDHPDNKKTPYDDPTLYHNGEFVQRSGYCTDIYFESAKQWISTLKDQPFFAYISMNCPHTPLIVDEKYSAPYKDKKMRKGADIYYGMIANIDDNVGQLDSWLKENGLDKNTILIFMTDNGHAISGSKGAGHGKDGFLAEDGLYNAGMRGGKGQAWEGGTRVPCFVRMPDRKYAGTDINALAGGIDILPTFAEIAGTAAPAGIDGKSLYPLIQNPSTPWPERFIIAHRGRWGAGKAKDSKYEQCAVRSQNYRLVSNNELHDMRKDPGETTNVIDQHPEQVAKMRAFYDDWWVEACKGMINESAAAEKKPKKSKKSKK